jgi:hypothetical protein
MPAGCPHPRAFCRSNFVGFAYPAYASLRALESEPRDDDKQCDKQWCVCVWGGG